MVSLILKILLPLSVLGYAVNIPLERFDMLFFIFSAMTLFTASLFDAPKRKANFALLAFLLLGLCILNLFWNKFNPTSISHTINLFLAIVSLWVIVTYAEEPKKYYKYICLAGLINIIVFIFQKSGFNPILNTSSVYDPGGIMGNGPRMITYLATILPIMASFSPFIYILAFMLSIIASEFSLALVLFVILFLKEESHWLRKVLLAIFIGGCVILRNNIITSLTVRWDFWKPVTIDIFKRPMLGYGFGAVHPKIDFFFNMPLQIFYGLGFLGVAWLVYVAKKYKNSLDVSTESLSIASLAILSMIEYPFEIGRLWLTIVAVIGFFLIKNTKEVATAYKNPTISTEIG